MTEQDRDTAAVVRQLVRDAEGWARSQTQQPRCLTTRDLLLWAFVNDPPSWTAATHAIGGAHPQDVALDVEEPIAPHTHFGFPVSVEASDANDIAILLLNNFDLTPDPTTLGFAATLATGGFAQEWATQTQGGFVAAAELSTALFGSQLAELSEFVSLTAGKSEVVERPDLASSLRRGCRLPLLGSIVTVAVLHFGLHLQLPLAIMAGIVAAVAVPDLGPFQTRRRLGVAELASLVVLIALTALGVSSLAAALDESHALSQLKSGEALERHGLHREALDKLTPLDNRLLTVPRLHLAIACAAFAEGKEDYAIFNVEIALSFGASSTAAPEVPDCFLNHDFTHKWISLADPFGTLIVVPRADPENWRPIATRLLREGHYGDALLALGCAHHSVGLRDTAAYFATLGIHRLSIDLKTRDPLAPVAAGKARGVENTSSRCIRELGESGFYERHIDRGRLTIRPLDYRSRTP